MTSLNSLLAQAPYPIIGLTGGIAVGKTYVAALLATSGWITINIDQIARVVVEPGTKGLEDLIAAFSTDILNQDGSLNRHALGELIFSNHIQRSLAESILYPHIEANLASNLAALPQNIKGVILDAPLWVEFSLAHIFDALWVVEAPRNVRIKRLMERDKLDQLTAIKRILIQSDGVEKKLHADYVFYNNDQNLEKSIKIAEKTITTKWKKNRMKKWRSAILPPFTLTQLHTILEALLSSGGDYAEIFIEQRKACGLGMEDGKLEDVLSQEVFGVSLQVIDKEVARFADLIAPTIDELIVVAKNLSSSIDGTYLPVSPLITNILPNPSPIDLEPSKVPITEKVALLRTANGLARQQAESLEPGKLRQVAVGYSDRVQHVWITTAERQETACSAIFTEDHRTHSTLRINVTIGEEENLQTGYKAISETSGFELFTKNVVEKTVSEAVRLAVQALNAHPTPAGTFPVIIHSSAGGTIIHEACGHGLEADLVLAGVSAFSSDKLGTKVANDNVSVIDDGTLPHKSGSSTIDDEGKPTKRVVLIENGILKGYLQSRKTAQKMNTKPTGNGRRESYLHHPIPRMRNTFLAPGQDDPKLILKDLDKGLLVKHMGGGQVDTVTGNFVFQVTEGYWVENGNVLYPVKNATLAGCGPELLMNLTRIGSDLHHFDVGTCGKDGQGVPVSDALPTILCPNMVVGGTV